MRIPADRPRLVLRLLVFVCAGGLLSAQTKSTHGPAHGSLVLQGGIGVNQAVASAFVTLAGGPGSHIVVIPTASVGNQLAIGIDEETALVVTGVVGKVVGSGTVRMYDGHSRGAPNVVVLRSGDQYDLSTRRRK